ncbi:toxin Tbo-IT2-like isoform X1 [Ornithodoros turicata]|uniref:toxin Tbo-IT2-like isoform X1 n=1 Tax=Ornithodoros turicata TaxID=34597 RepID=UPI003138EE13
MNSQAVALALLVVFLVNAVLAVPYNNYEVQQQEAEPNTNAPMRDAGESQRQDQYDSFLDEYKERLENYLMSADKRSCVRRGGSCDGRPHDCCHQSACRCNLWGTNCRCQRAGLFQTLGKK